MKITIDRLPESKWEEFKKIRLEALKNDARAFGSSYEEEITRPEEMWRSRIKSGLFALDESGKPIGLMAFLIGDRVKTKHKAEIYSVYVKPEFRGTGVSKKLFTEALRLIKLNPDVCKVNLTVNPLQKAAVKLYETFGFKKTGTLHKELLINGIFYDEDLMELIFE